MKKSLLSLLFILAIASAGNAQVYEYFNFEGIDNNPVIVNTGSTYNGAVENPLKSGLNTSDSVGMVTKGNNGWDGITYWFKNNLNLKEVNTFSLLVFHPTIGNTRIRLVFTGDYGSINLDNTNYTTPGEWQLLTWEVPKEWDKKFNRVGFVFAHNPHTAGSVWYFDEFKGAPVYPVNPPRKYFNTYNFRQEWSGFSGAEYNGILDNPAPDNINDQPRTAKTTTGNEGWAGITLDLPGPIDFSTDSVFTMYVHSDYAADVRVQLEKPGDGANKLKISVPYTTPNSWQRLEFKITEGDGTITDDYWTRVVLIFDDKNNTPGKVWYFDDLWGPRISPTEEPARLYFNFETPESTPAIIGSTGTGAKWAGVQPNPFGDPVNPSPLVGKSITGNAAWDRIYYDLPSTISFSDGFHFKMKVFTEDLIDGLDKDTVYTRIQLERIGGASSAQIKLSKKYNQVGNWVELTFDARADRHPDGNASAPVLDDYFNRIAFIFNDKIAKAGEEWFFDELRGPALTPIYYVNTLFRVHTKVAGVGKYEIEINNSGNKLLLYNDKTHGDETANDTIWSLAVDQLPVGSHTLNVYADDVLVGTGVSFNLPEISSVHKVDFFHFGTSVNNTEINNKLSVYPNPVFGDLTVKSSGKIAQISVYNLLGAEILSIPVQRTSEHSFSTSELKAGIYILRVKDDTGVVEVVRFNKR